MPKATPDMPAILVQKPYTSKVLLVLVIPIAFVLGVLFSSSCLMMPLGGTTQTEDLIGAKLQGSLFDHEALYAEAYPAQKVTGKQEIVLEPVPEAETKSTDEIIALAQLELTEGEDVPAEVQAEVELENLVVAEPLKEEAIVTEQAPTIETVTADDNEAMPFVAAVYLQATGYPIPTTIDEIKRMREQLTSLDPNATITWGMDLLYVIDEKNREAIQYVLELVDTHGDEIGIGYGFPNNLHDTQGFADVMWEWIYFYRYNAFTDLHVHQEPDARAIWESIPDKYKPKSFVTYAINHEQAAWARENFEIQNFMGWTATQYNVDQLSGTGSPLMPYYSHQNNPMVPAQSEADHSGNFFINTITVDPIGSKYTQDASRWTIHPADPYISGATPQIHAIEQYLNNPYRDQNTQDYLSLFIDINWMYRDQNLEQSWANTIENWPLKNTHPIKVMSISDFAKRFEARAGKNNDTSEFTLLFRGSGDELVVHKENGEKPVYVSESNVQYLWTETKSQRFILAKADEESAWRVIDFTDYSGEVDPLRYTSGGKYDDVSFVTGRNYKIAKEAPLTEDEIERIKARLKVLEFTDEVVYE